MKNVSGVLWQPCSYYWYYTIKNMCHSLQWLSVCIVLWRPCSYYWYYTIKKMCHGLQWLSVCIVSWQSYNRFRGYLKKHTHGHKETINSSIFSYDVRRVGYRVISCLIQEMNINISHVLLHIKSSFTKMCFIVLYLWLFLTNYFLLLWVAVRNTAESPVFANNVY
jgi:hypothetical protein